MGFVTMGIFAGNEQGMQGAVFQMLSHGLISGALFLCVGVVYDRMHTREIAFYGGLTARMPWYAAIFLMFTMANVGLPGTSGFIGEVLTMAGAYEASTWTVLIAASGVIFSAVYALTLYRNVMFGEITNPALQTITDIDRRELLVFVPLIIGTIWLGIYPAAVLDITAASVEAVTTTYRAAIGG
jgi:NADH-quinone oxidoreductase subunit M